MGDPKELAHGPSQKVNAATDVGVNQYLSLVGIGLPGATGPVHGGTPTDPIYVAVTTPAGDPTDVNGDVAHDAVDSGNPVKVGFKAEATTPAAVADNDRSNLSGTLYGAAFVNLRKASDGTEIDPRGGDVAHDAVDAGNPVKIGGKATASAEFVADGDRVNISLDTAGRVRVLCGNTDGVSGTITPTFFVDEVAPSTVAEGQQGGARITPTRDLRVCLTDSAGANHGALGNNLFVSAVCQGFATHDDPAINGNPLMVGGLATAAQPSAVSAGNDMVRAYFDLTGYQHGKSLPYGLAAAIGRLGNARVIQQIATASIPTAVTRSFWGNAATASQTILTANTALEIVSDNAADAAAGTGARTVLITGLNDSFVAVTETVTMNGVTPVALVNQYMRINDAVVVTAGTGQSNTGVITIQLSGAGAAQNVMTASVGKLNQLFYTVPAGKVAFIAQIQFGSMGDTIVASYPLKSTAYLGRVAYTGATAADVVKRHEHRFFSYRGGSVCRDFSGAGFMLPAKALYTPSVQNNTADTIEFVGDLIIVEFDA